MDRIIPNIVATVDLDQNVFLTDSQKSTFTSLHQPNTLGCIVAKSDAPESTLFYLEYLSKGAANAVYKCCLFDAKMPRCGVALQLVDVKDGGSYARPMSNKVVRDMVLRIPRGMPKCLSAEDIMKGFEDYIAPLFTPDQNTSTPMGDADQPTAMSIPPSTHDFSKHLMLHGPVALFPEVMMHLIQDSTSGTFHKLPTQDHLPLEHTRLAIFLPDMSTVYRSHVTLEIKPKWLAQSPDAPENSVRCRTCAMQVLHPKKRDAYICPLRLVNGANFALYTWIDGMVEAVRRNTPNDFGVTTEPGSGLHASIIHAITYYLTEGDGRKLLQHLRYLQCELDPDGILHRPTSSSDGFDHNLRLAMTLRDCSLFIKVPYDAEGKLSGEITSKLGDLDFKSAAKIPDWAEKEAKLQAECAYTKKLVDEVTKVLKDDVQCWLWPKK